MISNLKFFYKHFDKKSYSDIFRSLNEKIRKPNKLIQTKI